MSLIGSVSKWISCAVFASVLLTLPSPPNAQTPTPGMTSIPGMTAIEQVELTNDTAKNAIDSYIALKEEYGDDGVPPIGPNTPAGAMQGLQAYQGIAGIVNQYGFAGIEEWHLTLRSVIIAHSFLEEGRMEEFEQSMAKMQQQNLPEPMASQMLAMLQGLKPSDNNLAVLTNLAADAEYGPKLNSVQN